MAGEIQREFEGYVAAAYGKQHGLGKPQMDALKDAFFGGAVTALTLKQDPRPEIRAYLGEVYARIQRKAVADA